MARLTDIPVELFSMIMSNIEDHKDLQRLRLVCREVNQKTIVYFSDISFKAISITVGPECFDKMLRVTEHEQFRRSIREVDICAASNRLTTYESSQDQLNMDYVMKGFFAYDLDKFFQRVSPKRLAIGSGARSSGENSLHEWQQIVKTIFAETCKNNIHWEEISILDRCTDSQARPLCLFLPLPLLGRLKTLRLTHLSNVEDYIDGPERVSFLADVLLGAPNLQNLYMGCNWSVRCSPIIASITNSIRYSQPLKFLHLDGMVVGEPALVQLLQNCPQSLKEIRLEDFGLSEGGWKVIFTTIKHKFVLDSISLFDLMEKDRYISFSTIKRQRPEIIPFSSRRSEMSNRIILPGEREYDKLTENEKELSKMDHEIFHKYEWVGFLPGHYVKFSKEDNDDMDECLSMLIDYYTISLF